MEDTVEHQVDGLAERIIAEDAERRAQDLVSCVSHAEPPPRRAQTRRARSPRRAGSVQHRT